MTSALAATACVAEDLVDANEANESLGALEVPVRRLVCARPAFEVGQGEEACDGEGVV